MHEVLDICTLSMHAKFHITAYLGRFPYDGNKNSAAEVERVVSTAATSEGSNEREKNIRETQHLDNMI